MKRIAILASGSGTNAENLIKHFKNSQTASVEWILTNRPDAFVLERAKLLGVASMVFTKFELNEQKKVLNHLIQNHIDLIILAGFLWLIPEDLIKYYSDRIINIHPALLPSYGGKGMYGARVHQAVIQNKEKESGITIHLVNEVYDEGRILFQAKCPVHPHDTPDLLASRIHELEYRYFPEIVEKYLGEL